jgi:hypothetical protein
MLKAIQGIKTVEVITKLGSDIDLAKKECQFLATIISCNVRLTHNSDTYIIDKNGSCVQENNNLADLIEMCKRG